MKRVYIIVLNWNRQDETLKCLSSLEKLSDKNIEISIVVVDNDSSESTKKLKSYKSSKFNYFFLKTKKNLGYAEGNNVGINFALKSGAEYVMVINNDTIVDKNLVVELVKPFLKDKKIGITSPKIYFAKGFEFHKDRYKRKDLGRVIWYAGGEIDWRNVYGINIGVDEVDKGQFDKQKEIDFATGACIMFSRKALKKSGLFNWKYFLYLEDLELSLRVRKKGFKIVFVPKAKLWHKVSQSSGIGSGLNDYFLTRNRLFFGFKYAGLRAKFALAREALKMLIIGRSWQKQGVIDFLLVNVGKGSWKN